MAISTLGLVLPPGDTSSKSLGAQVVLSREKSNPPDPDSSHGGNFEEATHLTAGFCGLSIRVDMIDI
jgi:hypothetical protein